MYFTKGYDYNRTTHLCKNCNANQPKVVMSSILNGLVQEEVNIKGYFSIERQYVALSRSITFEYKEDNFNKIDDTYYESGNINIDLICVFVKSENYKRYIVMME